MQTQVLERDHAAPGEPFGLVGVHRGAPRCVSFGPFCLYVQERRLTERGKSVSLGSRSLDILVALVERPGVVVSKQDLMARAWPGLHVEESSLRGHIAGLRKVLGEGRAGARFIANVQGRGYCFVANILNTPQEHTRPDHVDAATERSIEQVLTSDRFAAALKIALHRAVQEVLASTAHARNSVLTRGYKDG